MPFGAILYFEQDLTTSAEQIGSLLEALSFDIPGLFGSMQGEVNNRLFHMTRWTPYSLGRAVDLAAGGRVRSVVIADTTADRLESSSLRIDFKRHDEFADNLRPLSLSLDLNIGPDIKVVGHICDTLSEFAGAVAAHYGVAHAERGMHELGATLGAIPSGTLAELMARPPGYKDPYEEELGFYQTHEPELQRSIRRIYWGNWVGPIQWRIIQPLLASSDVRCHRVVRLEHGGAFFSLTKSPYDAGRVLDLQKHLDCILAPARIPGAPPPTYHST